VTGRLELDDDGRVVGSAEDPVDLADAPDPVPVPREPGPVARTVGPWVRRHRRGLLAATAAVVAGALALGWWTGRPPERAPVLALDLTNAILDRNSIGGPEVSPDGVLEVAFTAVAPAGMSTTVTGLVGPGLGTSTVEAATVGDQERVRIQASAPVVCTDPALRDAGPSDYALEVSAATESGASAQGLVPLTLTVPGARAVTRLNLAAADWCLRQAAVEVLDVSATPVPGVPLADLAVRVRNTGAVPVLVATDRSAGDDLDIDLSPDAAVDPGSESVLTTRTVVQDCTAPPQLSELASLPNATGSGAGLTLVLRSGGTYTLRSVEVPGADALGRRLGATLCADAPSASATVRDVRRLATTPGSWRLRATIDVRTEGIGVRVGRETFLGPPAGAGSFLGVIEDGTPDSPWDAAPARLDGGAGRLEVELPGGSCRELDSLRPGSLPLRVLTADGRVFPVEVALDDIRLIEAAYAGCALEPASGNQLLDRGWPVRLLRLPGGVGP
jgi:hypothetical protein